MRKAATILFPSDYFDKTAVDGAFITEYEAALADARLAVGLFSLEGFEETGRVAPRGDARADAPLVYRGWMMKPAQYAAFHAELVRLGLSPVTAPGAYDELHMYPLAYERNAAIRDASPKLLAFPGTEVDAAAVNAAFDRFMVKDYVKSEKGTSFPACIQTPVTQGQMDALVGDFVRRRGGLFTEGIALKEFVDLRDYGGTKNEWRAFYLAGRTLTVCLNTERHISAPRPPEALVASCEGLASPFYTVDFGELEDGSWVVLETGDDQVSGLAAGQNPVLFYQALADRLGEGAGDAV